MIKYTLLSAAIFFILSCRSVTSPQESGTDSTSVDSAAIINDPKNNLNVQTSSFSEIDSSGIIMFPLSMGESKESNKRVYKDIPSTNYWNIIFYNSHTAEYHLLSERKMLIGSFETSYTRYDDVDVAFSSKHIFYRVTTDDYDQDKKLTTDDPEYLFISDKQGKNFRQISPSGTSIRSWQFIKASNKTIMTVTRDSNKDKSFDGEDEVASLKLTWTRIPSQPKFFPRNLKRN